MDKACQSPSAQRGTARYRARPSSMTSPFPHRWTLGGVTVEADFTGGHLFHLAAVGCVLNDLYREAAALGNRIDRGPGKRGGRVRPRDVAVHRHRLFGRGQLRCPRRLACSPEGNPAPTGTRVGDRLSPALPRPVPPDSTMSRFWRVRWCRDHGFRDHARRAILRLSVSSSLPRRRVGSSKFRHGTGHAPGASRRNLRRPALVLVKTASCFCSCQDCQALDG